MGRFLFHITPSQRGFTGRETLRNQALTDDWTGDTPTHFSRTLPPPRLPSRGTVFMAPGPYETQQVWSIPTPDAPTTKCKPTESTKWHIVSNDIYTG